MQLFYLYAFSTENEGHPIENAFIGFLYISSDQATPKDSLPRYAYSSMFSANANEFVPGMSAVAPVFVPSMPVKSTKPVKKEARPFTAPRKSPFTLAPKKEVPPLTTSRNEGRIPLPRGWTKMFKVHPNAAFNTDQLRRQLASLPSGSWQMMPPTGNLVEGDDYAKKMRDIDPAAFVTEFKKELQRVVPVTSMDGIMWMRGDLAKKTFGVLDARQGRPGKTVRLPEGAGAFQLTGDLAKQVPNITERIERLFQEDIEGLTFAQPRNRYDKRILAYTKGAPEGLEYKKIPIADVLSFVDAETADFIVSTAKTIADFIGTRDYSVIERWTLIIIQYPEAPRKGKEGGFPFNTDGTSDFGGPGMVFNVAMGKGDVPKFFDYKPLFGKHTRPIRQELPHGSVAFMTGESRTQSAHGVPKMQGTQITLAFKLPAEDFFGTDKPPSYIKVMKNDPQFKYAKPYYYIDADEAFKAHTTAAV